MINRMVKSVDNIPKNANANVIGNDKRSDWKTFLLILNRIAKTTV